MYSVNSAVLRYGLSGLKVANFRKNYFLEKELSVEKYLKNKETLKKKFFLIELEI